MAETDKAPTGAEEPKMTVKTCHFVNRSDVFAGLDKAWEALSDSYPDLARGGNNHTLIGAPYLLVAMRETHGNLPGALKGGELETALSQSKEAVERLRGLGEMLIDLEN